MCLFLSLGAASPATARDFQGQVLPGRTPSLMTSTVCVDVSDRPDGLPVAETDVVSRCSFDVYVTTGAPEHVLALIVRPSENALPVAYVDADRDGRFSPTERVGFAPSHEWDTRARAMVNVRPFTPGSATPLPFEIGLPSRDAIARYPWLARSVLYSVTWFVTSTVAIDGRVWYFRSSVAADAETPDLVNGWWSVGGRRWTRADRSFSPMEQWSQGEPAVFRLGSRYVSVASIDMPLRRIVLRERNPDEYRRLELREGMLLPDFTFVDLDGRAHRLSEFAGRAVLLNFWYAGCTPCMDELPFIHEALRRFGPDRLVVVGLSISPYERSSRLRESVSPEEPGWIEADPWNVSRLVKEWFQVHSTPLQILLGPDGRVRRLGISRNGRSPLRGSELVRTLGRVVPGVRPDRVH